MEIIIKSYEKNENQKFRPCKHDQELRNNTPIDRIFEEMDWKSFSRKEASFLQIS